MRRFPLAALAAALAFVSACESAAEKKPVVVMETSKGTIKIELDAARCPATVENFLHYVDDKFYDGTVFHRVMKDFMIQGGGFEKGVCKATNRREFQAREKQTRAAIKNEATDGLSNTRGTMSMARTDDPDSATSQFFINVVDNSRNLDHNDAWPGYCAFGKVIDGMDVVDKIREVKTKGLDDGSAKDVPVEDVVIKSVRRADNK
jgi:cyclophilin family peptidyl-prolyl cis-trans isomerase